MKVSKRKGVEKSKTISGCGGIFNGVCRGGCLEILKARYSCWKQGIEELDQKNLKIVKHLCDNKENCKVKVNRDTFGYTACPKAEDWEMNLWVTYRCDGGKDNSYIRRQIRSTGCKANI